jgi:zeaxanthin glucosyltransferase
MAHIVIFMLWEGGHILPTFRIARDLTARGNRVTYLTVPDLVQLPASRNFATAATLADSFPKGCQGRWDMLPEDEREQAVAAFYRDAQHETVEQQIAALNPDAVARLDIQFDLRAQSEETWLGCHHRYDVLSQ